MSHNTSYVYFCRGAEHAQMGVPSIASVRRNDPSARVIVAFETGDPTGDILGPLSDWHIEIEPGLPLWVADAEAQRIAVHESEEGDTLWFLDTDTLVLQPMPMITGDLAFTWRTNWKMDAEGKPVVGLADQMPYNGGVTGARSSLAALDGITWIKHRMLVMARQYQFWYGDQFASAELCGPRPETDHELREIALPLSPTVRGSKVMVELLPCRLYNYWPREAGEDLSEKYLLHFKGKAARHLMAGYLQALGYAQPVVIPAPPEIHMIPELE